MRNVLLARASASSAVLWLVAVPSTRRTRLANPYTAILGASLFWLACGPGGLDVGGGRPGTTTQNTPPACSGLCISSLSPPSVVAGGPDLTLTVTGTGFSAGHHPGTRVLWVSEGAPIAVLPTQVNSSTELTTIVPSSLLVSPGVSRVRLENYDPMGDGPNRRSNSLDFKISQAQPPPPPPLAATGFSATGSMGVPRTGHSAALLRDGSVLVVGGWGQADFAPGAELFDPSRETFASTGNPVALRVGATATLLSDGRVLVVGGWGSCTTSCPRFSKLSSAELYDPGTRTFSATGSMAVPRVLHTSTRLADGRVLIAGGMTGGGVGTAIPEAEIFDPDAGTFVPVGSMGSGRADHTATLLASGKVLIVGGWNGHPPDAADDPPWDPLFVELFDPSSGSFSPGGTDSTTRGGRHGSVRLWDDRVLVVGGVWDIQNRHEQPRAPAYAELFDPATAGFSPLGSVRFSQRLFTFTDLSGRQVLVAGGIDAAGSAVATASVIDAASQSVSAVSGMQTARVNHTASRLLDGRVLVTGGDDAHGFVHSSAELFR